MMTTMGHVLPDKRRMKASGKGIVASVLPGLTMLGMFYSLAFHMYRSLGGWPTAIGERGFPASLVTHADVTMYFFIALICSNTFVLPAAIVACGLHSYWRRF